MEQTIRDLQDRRKIEKRELSEQIDATSKFNSLQKYMGKYQISFQFWGEGNNNVFIEKRGVSLYDSGQHQTPADAIGDALAYLRKINKH